MGFRCPICNNDFGRDREAWRKHLAEAHLGAGQDVVDLVLKTAETGNSKEDGNDRDSK